MLISLRHRASPTTTAAKANNAAKSGQAEDGLSRLSLTSTQGIEVEEIGQVEFTREWARAITREALAQTGKQLEAADGVEDVAGALPHSSP